MFNILNKNKKSLVTTEPDIYCDIKEVEYALNELNKNVPIIYKCLKSANQSIIDEEFTAQEWAEQISNLNLQWKNVLENSKYAIYMSDEERMNEISELKKNTDEVFLSIKDPNHIFYGVTTCLLTIKQQVKELTPNILRSIDNGDYYANFYTDLTPQERTQLKNNTIDIKKNLKKLNELNEIAVKVFDLESFYSVAGAVEQFKKTIKEFNEKYQSIDALWGGAVSAYIGTKDMDAQQYMENLTNVQTYCVKQILDITSHKVQVPQVKGHDRVLEEPTFIGRHKDDLLI